MKKTIKIFDVDGVLLSSLKRYRTKKNAENKDIIDLPYWQDNTHLAAHDELLPHSAIYFDALKNGDFVIIATARAMQDGDIQHSTMLNKLGKPSHLIYRKEGDNRRGFEMKLAGIKRLLNLKQFAGCKLEIWEDNGAQLILMVDTLRDLGYDVVGHYVPSNQGH